MTLAGRPATRVLAGTSLLTKAPAATTALSPTVTPGKIVASAPIQTFLPIITDLSSSLWRSWGFKG